jgi:tRNA(fMet)-specific endonuclease VapC
VQRYLLDTNILTDIVRHPFGKCASRCRDLGDERICTSIIVACELRFGASKKGSADLTKRLEQLLNGLEVLPFDEPADCIYAEARVQLERAGTPIGEYDLLIAAHASSNECTLVTDNVREFQRVPSLKMENWLRD